MKKLTEELKRMLSAMAFAEAGENLTLRQKTGLLVDPAAESGKPMLPPKIVDTRPQVGLYMGSELPVDVMKYVMQTCVRLKHGLTVLSFQSEADTQALLAEYQAALAESAIPLRVSMLQGEPAASLGYALRRMPEVAFLICNESGYFGHGLLNGAQRKDGLPVPVVLVAASDSAKAAATAPVVKGRTHAA